MTRPGISCDYLNMTTIIASARAVAEKAPVGSPERFWAQRYIQANEEIQKLDAEIRRLRSVLKDTDEAEVARRKEARAEAEELIGRLTHVLDDLL